MNGRHTTALLLGLADCLSLLLVFNVIAFFRGVTPWDQPILSALVLPCAFFLAAIYLIEGYDSRTDFISLDYTSVHIIALIFASLATLLVTFVFLPTGYSLNESRSVIVLGYLTLIPLTIGYRRMWYMRVSRARRQRMIIFAGDSASCRDFEAECRQMHGTQSVLLCMISERPEFHDPMLISLREAIASIEAGEVEPEAIVLREANAPIAPDISDKLVKLYFGGVPVYTLEYFHETYWGKIPRYRLNQIWLFQEGFRMTREPVFEHAKRLTDLFLAGFGLLLFSPLLLLASAAIWLEDRGPIFFAQTRIGRSRVPFRMFKLRTMRVQAGGDPYTRESDARITRVGRFLRASRLDEVPQLWNVLRGDMSLIGPRAEWDRLVLLYENEIPCYHFRHLVKPGITGWAQINYPYGANMEDTMRKLEYDLYYIRHFSFLLDATIVLKTIHVMLFGKGR